MLYEIIPVDDDTFSIEADGCEVEGRVVRFYNREPITNLAKVVGTFVLRNLLGWRPLPEAKPF